jgi:hypothetical protein
MTDHPPDAYATLTAELVNLRSNQAPPDQLFHYTSAGGLLEIVQTNRIWASS